MVRRDTTNRSTGRPTSDVDHLLGRSPAAAGLCCSSGVFEVGRRGERTKVMGDDIPYTLKIYIYILCLPSYFGIPIKYSFIDQWYFIMQKKYEYAIVGDILSIEQ